MSAKKETSMPPPAVAQAVNVNPATSQPTSTNSGSHWASPGPINRKSELEAKFEAMRARNWITERMVQQYQKHWHCSREEALERLLAKAGG